MSACWGFEYWAEDFVGHTGGSLVFDTEEEARKEQSSLLVAGWHVGKVRPVECRDPEES